MLLEDLITFDLLGKDVDQDHVLRWGQAHLGVVGIDYLTQSTLETYLIRILDASCLHEKPQKRPRPPAGANQSDLPDVRIDKVVGLPMQIESTFQLPGGTKRLPFLRERISSVRVCGQVRSRNLDEPSERPWQQLPPGP